MFCEIISITPTQNKCKNCGKVTHISVTQPKCSGRRKSEETQQISPESPHFPSLTQQAISFGKAVINHAQDNFSEVNPAEYERRKSICEGCPHFEPNSKRCMICGCSQIKLKWKSSVCPDTPPRWGV